MKDGCALCGCAGLALPGGGPLPPPPPPPPPHELELGEDDGLGVGLLKLLGNGRGLDGLGEASAAPDPRVGDGDGVGNADIEGDGDGDAEHEELGEGDGIFGRPLDGLAVGDGDGPGALFAAARSATPAPITASKAIDVTSLLMVNHLGGGIGGKGLFHRGLPVPHRDKRVERSMSKPLTRQFSLAEATCPGGPRALVKA